MLRYNIYLKFLFFYFLNIIIIFKNKYIIIIFAFYYIVFCHFSLLNFFKKTEWNILLKNL